MDSTQLTLELLAPLHVESLPSEGRRLPTVSYRIDDQTWSPVEDFFLAYLFDCTTDYHKKVPVD